MEEYKMDDLPDTILAEVFMHFPFHLNFSRRRLCRRWYHLLKKVYVSSHLFVDLTKAEKISSWKNMELLKLYETSLADSIDEWFLGFEDAERKCSIFLHGGCGNVTGSGAGGFSLSAYGNFLLVKRMKKFMGLMKYPPPQLLLINIRLAATDILYLRVDNKISNTGYVPAACRLVLKNCSIGGIDWCRLSCSRFGPGDTHFTIPITGTELVDIGDMTKGYSNKDGSYVYGEGEREVFRSELLRLGLKYFRKMSDIEKDILWRSSQQTYSLFYYSRDLPAE